MQTTLVFQSNNLGESKRKLLGDTGLREVEPSGSMEWKLMCSSPLGVVAAYSTGKIVIQGEDELWVKSKYTVLALGKTIDFRPHIGVDEAGKGDFFGPLVVCALFVPSEGIAKDLELEGVRDSKTISDSSVLKMSRKVVCMCPDFEVISIGPGRLTKMLKQSRNINKVLAWAHSQAIENVLEKIGYRCKLVVVDQFSKKRSRVLDALKDGGSKLEVVQMHHGEADIAVAAASVVARADFIRELEQMSKRYGIDFPKGATDVVDTARKYVKQNGRDMLSEVAKTSFKITSNL